MKRKPSRKEWKKKRKSGAKQTLPNEYNFIKFYTPLWKTLVPRRSKRIKERSLRQPKYFFEVTEKIKREISAITRTVRNKHVSKTLSARQISINDRFTALKEKSQPLVIDWNSNYEFLEGRSVKMADESSKAVNSFGFNLEITKNLTFDHILKMRKKRLANLKAQKLATDEEMCNKAVESDSSVIEIYSSSDENACPKGNVITEKKHDVVNETTQLVEVKHTNVLECSNENNNIENESECEIVENTKEINEGECEIIENTKEINEGECEIVENSKESKVNVKQIEVIVSRRNTSSPETNNEDKCKMVGSVEKEYQNIEIKNIDIIDCTLENNNLNHNEHNENYNSVEENWNIIDLDSFNSSVLNVTSPNNSCIINIEEETPMKGNSTEYICDQSVIIVTPKVNDLPEASSNRCTKRKGSPLETKNSLKRRRGLADGSIISIPDTPDILQQSDNDIIFVSEECQLSPIVRRSRFDQRSAVEIVNDNDNKQSKARSVKSKKRKKKKNKCTSTVTSTTSTSSTVTSKPTTCAVENYILKRPLADSTAIAPYPNQFSRTVGSVAENLFSLHVPVPNNSFMEHLQRLSTVVLNNLGSHEGRAVPLREPIIPRMNNNNSKNSVGVRKVSNDPYGSNIYNAGHVRREGLREIIIDGSNIALGHSNGQVFSVKGLNIAIDYFVKKGHKVKAFVPQYRLKSGQCTNPQLLQHLGKKGLVIFTPSREVRGKRITPYDDRYIIQYATTCEGIVVSNDNYRDLLKEKPEWRDTIEQRLLMYTWIEDILFFAEDPLGKHGPTLHQLLRFP